MKMTLVPALTVKRGGSKAKFSIEMFETSAAAEPPQKLLAAFAASRSEKIQRDFPRFDMRRQAFDQARMSFTTLP